MKYVNNVLCLSKSAIKKTTCTMIFTFVLISIFNFFPLIASAATELPVYSFPDFETALATANNGDEIAIYDNIEMTDTVSIPDGKEITIRSANGSYFILERAADFKGPFFSIPDISIVTFSNIVLDGKNHTANSSLIVNGGTLNLNTGTHLTNNNKHAPTYVGGALYNSGTLNIMSGSAISNCFSGSYGGSVQNEGNVIMSGGIIIGNTGEGGVQNAGNGTFKMNGGMITGNMDPNGNSSGAGAGAQNYGGNFSISGDAKIYTNTISLNDRILLITDALIGAIAVYVPPDAIDGTVIATGADYTLQESDKAVFSVNNGFSLLLKNNNIVLSVPSTTPAPETTPETPSITPAPETTPETPSATPAPETTPETPSTIPAPETTSETQIPVTGISLDRENANILVGETLQLEASIIPPDATNTGVTWASSDSNVVQVNTSGNITGIKAGTATITVTTEDGGYTATCNVIVRENAVPKTGDTNDPWPWVATGVLSALLGLFLSARKKQPFLKK